MIKNNFILIVFLSLFLSACASQSSDEPVFKKAEGYVCTERVIPNEYLMHYKNGDIEIVHSESDEAFLEEHFEPNKELLKTAEPNYEISVSMKVTNNSTPRQDNWGAMAIRADRFWSQGHYGKDLLISVIDTGVDIEHSQLRDQIFKNSGEMGKDEAGKDKRSNGIDDDGNGLVDDWAGYDFFHRRALSGDNSSHGTHVAGIIAGTHSSRAAGLHYGVQGIAPQSKILPIAFLGPDGKGSIDDAIRAIRYSVARGAKIINASWGGPGCSITLRDEVRALQEKNILFVAAAGNNGVNLDTWPEYPASFEALSQITVGSVDANFQMSSFSNYSPRFVHLFAPGGGITSTTPGNQYATFSGTSMAAPFVSGAAALIWAKNPHFSAIDVRNEILRSIFIQPEYLNQTRGRLLF